jgi:ABC-type multidrug transport system ATPase subunit
MRADTWLEALAHELAARGVRAADAAGIVVEAEGHLRETADAPLSAFGSPAAYAALVTDALDPDTAPRPLGGPRIDARRVARRGRLEPVDVCVHAGEAVLLMGRNGAGKSTLLQILAGLLEGDGEVRVEGAVGYAPQHGGLVDHLLPCEHFVLFGRGRGLSRATAIREGRRLADQLGWDAAAAPVAGALSGGTRQKLNVVLAALGEPDILLLDEPYQGLDLASVQRFWDFLWTWRDTGRCALVASHAHDAIDRADAVIEL